MLEQPLLLTGAKGSSFLNHCSLPNKVSQDTFGTLSLAMTYFCNLRDAMPRHSSPSTSHSTLPREAEGFLMGGKYLETCFCLLYWLLCNQFNQYFWTDIHMSRNYES